MERYQVILAYDGTDFHGSQLQKNTRTVQSELQTALRKLRWSGSSVLFAGRTDAGVHATGQVVSFNFAWNHTLDDLRNALNALLPEDMAVFEVRRVRPDFHPRFDAVSRTYRYCLYSQSMRNPLIERFSWRVWPRPDHERLEAGAALFQGIHDFAGFGRPTYEGGSTIRQITSSKWIKSGEKLFFEVIGNAFLYHMVRRLVYAQVMVGQGKLELDQVSRHLHDPGDTPLQGLAPAKGLTLVDITYSDPQARVIEES